MLIVREPEAGDDADDPSPAAAAVPGAAAAVLGAGVLAGVVAS